MTVQELMDYLKHYADNGNGDSIVYVCERQDNPITESVCIHRAAFIEENRTDCFIVLQY